jgi:nicotinamide-nucleotide amidase
LTEAGLEIGYCARVGAVDVRLSANGSEANSRLDLGEKIIRNLLGEYVYGEEDEELEQVIIRLLRERKQSLAVAESCTGGRIADRLTNVPGASSVFRAGLVTYSNEAKQEFLRVRRDTLDTHGAVSKAVALEMAKGARERNRTDYALAVTGIAGPSGGSLEKPVGTVFIALATSSHTFVLNPVNPYDRETFKQVTTQQALDFLRGRLLKQTKVV